MSRAWFLPTWIQAARKWHPRARRKRSVPCGWLWGQEDESSCRLVLAAERLAGFCSRCLFFQCLEISLETNENWRWLNILNIMSCSPQAQTSKVSSMVLLLVSETKTETFEILAWKRHWIEICRQNLSLCVHQTQISWISQSNLHQVGVIYIPDIPSLKLTYPLKMDGWNTTFLLGWPIFRCYVSFREGNF